MSTITTVALSTIFTAPASCSNSWTYEASTYNGISSGLLIQNALGQFWDFSCYPPGFKNRGRSFGNQVFSPGACPGGYVTQSPILLNGATTTAICCPRSFTYTTSNNGPQGCLSAYAGATSVAARDGGTLGSSDTTTSTSVSGIFTMWGVPITVEFQANQLGLYTTTTSSIPSSTSTGSAPTTPASQSTTAIPANTSGPSPPPSPSPSPSSGLSTGAKIGIAIGVVAVLILFAIAILAWRRKRRNAGSKDEAGEYAHQYEYKPQYQATAMEVGTENYARRTELGTGEEYRRIEMQG